MSDNATERAWEYFLDRTKVVYVDRCTTIESFEDYLEHRYRNNCYFYSAYALMGLKPQDFLVRGDICLERNFVWRNGGYPHGWVEFEFEGEYYVFDSMLEKPVPKQEYYDYYKPQITYKKSQKEILDEFLNERCAFRIADNFWQFKYFAINEKTKRLPYSEIIKIDRNNAYVPSALMFARMQLSKYTGEITRFIAYSEPSG